MHKIYHRADGTQAQVHLGGWKKQPKDDRDEAYRVKLHGSFRAIPASCDLRNICSDVEDQGNLGSCTAHMFAGLIESNEIRQRGVKDAPAPAAVTVTVSNIVTNANGISYTTTVLPAAQPAPTPAPTPTPAKLFQVSRLFEYYATRKIEGTVLEDSGATIRDAIKTGYTYGIADEATYPYDISKFAVNPPAAVWTAAASHKITSYHAISDGDVQTMKSVLAQNYLIGFGFQVYDYFMTAQMATKGLLGLPNMASESLQGGHAVCLCGYDDSKAMPDNTKGAFLVRNSWGKNWGLGGYFWMSYAYVQNTRLCSDFWVVNSSPV